MGGRERHWPSFGGGHDPLEHPLWPVLGDDVNERRTESVTGAYGTLRIIGRAALRVEA
jgi:hypothetical protein